MAWPPKGVGFLLVKCPNTKSLLVATRGICHCVAHACCSLTGVFFPPLPTRVSLPPSVCASLRFLPSMGLAKRSMRDPGVTSLSDRQIHALIRERGTSGTHTGTHTLNRKTFAFISCKIRTIPNTMSNHVGLCMIELRQRKNKIPDD